MRYNAEAHAFELTKLDVAALLAFASTDRTRVTITQVYFEPAKGRVSATDGHVLATAQNCGRTDDHAFGITRAALEQAKALLRRKTHELRVSRDGDTVVLRAVEASTGEVLSETRTLATHVDFPPVDEVVPERVRSRTSSSCGSIGFDCALLARLLDVQKATASCGARFQLPDGELEPLRVDLDDVAAGTSWTCVVMPMRI